MFEEIEFLQSNLKNQIVVLAFQVNAIFTFWNFFLDARIPMAKKSCWVFLNWIAFKSYRIVFKRREKNEESTHGNGFSRNKFLEVSNFPT